MDATKTPASGILQFVAVLLLLPFFFFFILLKNAVDEDRTWNIGVVI
jgi:hypothetical protein